MVADGEADEVHSVSRIFGGAEAAARRTLIAQDVSGCLEGRIGSAGLTPVSLAYWLDLLASPLADLKGAHRSGRLPLLRVPEAVDDIVAAETAFARLAEGARTVVFFGTGGASLGGQTLAQLGGWNVPGTTDAVQRLRPRVRFYDNLDGQTLQDALAGFDLAATRFVLNSKSGGTPETLTQAVAALDAVRTAGLAAAIPRMFLAVTEPSKGALSGLRSLCQACGIPVLDHDPQVGGRFSVLTNVGLVPAIARGLDVRAVRRGAKDVVDALLAAGDPHGFAPAVGAALAVGLARERGSRVAVMMPYADRLGRFADWYAQLWAESLGKGGVGTAPVPCLGPLDQHSQLQLFMDGPKEHFLTIVRHSAAGQGPRLPADLATAAGIGFMAGKTVGDLVAAQAAAVPEALMSAGRPVRIIEIDRLDEAAIGALMMHMMLETILAARLLGVDAFDQPAVELAKVLTRQRLEGTD